MAVLGLSVRAGREGGGWGLAGGVAPGGRPQTPYQGGQHRPRRGRRPPRGRAAQAAEGPQTTARAGGTSRGGRPQPTGYEGRRGIRTRDVTLGRGPGGKQDGLAGAAVVTHRKLVSPMYLISAFPRSDPPLDGS